MLQLRHRVSDICTTGPIKPSMHGAKLQQASGFDIVHKSYNYHTHSNFTTRADHMRSNGQHDPHDQWRRYSLFWYASNFANSKFPMSAPPRLPRVLDLETEKGILARGLVNRKQGSNTVISRPSFPCPWRLELEKEKCYQNNLDNAIVDKITRFTTCYKHDILANRLIAYDAQQQLFFSQ